MTKPGSIGRPIPARLAGAVAVVCIAAAGAGPAAAGPGRPVTLADRREVCVRGRCFDAELAVTAEERSTGLMFRESLAADRGMLFVFPREGIHPFWMKNTLIELDIIFIDAGRRVVSVAARATPCRREPCAHYAPTAPAAYALEIAGGLAVKLGVAPGDPVTFGEPTSPPPAASGRR